ncbi:rCG62653, partial [Rattus norvegicus]
MVSSDQSPSRFLPAPSEVSWSRLWPQRKACMEQMALKEVGGHPGEWLFSDTNTTEHLREGCNLNTLLRPIRGRAQTLGRSCSLPGCSVPRKSL